MATGEDQILERVLRLITNFYFQHDTKASTYVKPNFQRYDTKFIRTDEWPYEYRMDLEPAGTGSPLKLYPNHLKDCTTFALCPSYIDRNGDVAPCAFVMRCDDYEAAVYGFNNAYAAGNHLKELFPKNADGSIQTESEPISPVFIEDLLHRIRALAAGLPSES
jgi:hypothetical protein